MVGALGRPRRAERRLFVKFHAWHVLELPFIARVFPHVPWIFVFREPRVVLRSQAANPGAEVLAGTIDPAYLGLDLPTAGADSDRRVRGARDRRVLRSRAARRRTRPLTVRRLCVAAGDRGFRRRCLVRHRARRKRDRPDARRGATRCENSGAGLSAGNCRNRDIGRRRSAGGRPARRRVCGAAGGRGAAAAMTAGRYAVRCSNAMMLPSESIA